MEERLVMKKEVRERFEQLFEDKARAERAIRQAEGAALRYWNEMRRWNGSIFASVPASSRTSGFAGNVFFSPNDFIPMELEE